MFDENTVKLLRRYLGSSKQEKKQFWKSMEDFCEENGLAKGFYHPYIPLQHESVNNEELFDLALNGGVPHGW